MTTHQELVKAIIKDGQEIIDDLDPRKANLLHMVIGISGEAGELLDAVKKNAIHNKELDRENVIEELGDLEFYMEGLRQELGISREVTLEHNIRKLSTRYSGLVYSNQAAQERADKND
jgi:NTP pyrophosphatase (non-canonical NTP hydrolase)